MSKNLPSSIFGAEDRRTPSHLRSSEPKNEEPLPTFSLRSSAPRSKNLHLRSSTPKKGSKIGRKTERGVRLLRRWGRGFSEDGGESFDLPVPRSEEPSIFELRSPRNEAFSHLPRYRPDERSTSLSSSESRFFVVRLDNVVVVYVDRVEPVAVQDASRARSS